MRAQKEIKKLLKLILRNYFVSIVILAVLFVGLFSAARIFFSDSYYVYARVKVSQGLWWAATQKPSIWYVESIKSGLTEQSSSGKVLAEILNVRYYPSRDATQYDVYLDTKLRVSRLKNGKYNFKRMSVAVSAPIEFEFPTLLVSGTIIAFSEKPFEDTLVEKIIYLERKNALPWEYDIIRVGTEYFDGSDIVFKVLDKSADDTVTAEDDTYGNYPSLTSRRKYIRVKASIKVRTKNDGTYVYGEEQVIRPGSRLTLSTSDLTFIDYDVSKLE